MFKKLTLILPIIDKMLYNKSQRRNIQLLLCYKIIKDFYSSHLLRIMTRMMGTKVEDQDTILKVLYLRDQRCLIDLQTHVNQNVGA